MCLNKSTQKSFIIGPVSAVSLPEGNEVEMRDRETYGRAACALACHTPVPNGRHMGRYDVFQMDTSVCCPGSAKSGERVVNKLSPVEIYLLMSAVVVRGHHDVWQEKTPPETPPELLYV